VAAPGPAATNAAAAAPAAGPTGDAAGTPEGKRDLMIDALQSAVDSYMNEYKKAPTSVEQLRAGGYFNGQIPAGKKYKIDGSGKVSPAN
jgi:competence protein ComGC